MSDSTPWFPSDGRAEAKRHAPATLRNRDAIADVLATLLPEQGAALEIASGSGEHIVHFAQRFASIRWQPSDVEPEACRSVAAWAEEAGLPNIAAPLLLDAGEAAPALPPQDAVLCINMVHIAPWAAAIGLFDIAANVLRRDGFLYLYGPYLRADAPTAPSNIAFDENLRSRDPRWGLRSVEAMDHLARAHALEQTATIEMPANNLSLVYRFTGRD